MADEMTTPMPRCPWCSAVLPIPGAEACSACGATLVTSSGADPEIKGVTTLDPEAILRARAEVARPRSRLFSFLTGDTGVDTSRPASAESLAPPEDAVRREMLRLEVEAERTRRQAETIALKADVLAQRGIHVSELGGGIDAPHGAEAAEPDAPDAADGAPGA